MVKKWVLFGNCDCTGLFKVDCISRGTSAASAVVIMEGLCAVDATLNAGNWFPWGQRAHGQENTQRFVLPPEHQPSPKWIWSQTCTGALPDLSILPINYVSRPPGTSKHGLFLWFGSRYKWPSLWNLISGLKEIHLTLLLVKFTEVVALYTFPAVWYPLLIFSDIKSIG